MVTHDVTLRAPQQPRYHFLFSTLAQLRSNSHSLLSNHPSTANKHRQFSVTVPKSPIMPASQSEAFKKAVADSKKLTSKPANDELLELYGTPPPNPLTPLLSLCMLFDH